MEVVSQSVKGIMTVRVLQLLSTCSYTIRSSCVLDRHIITIKSVLGRVRNYIHEVLDHVVRGLRHYCVCFLGGCYKVLNMLWPYLSREYHYTHVCSCMCPPRPCN